MQEIIESNSSHIENVITNAPPDPEASPSTAADTNGRGRKRSEQEILAEFTREMRAWQAGTFPGLWQEAALIIQYEAELCRGVNDEDRRGKKLRRLKDIYVREFDLSETTAQRYKRVYQFFAPLVESNGEMSPSLETLAAIGMSRLDVLLAIYNVAPDAWTFTEQGHVEMNPAIWSGGENDVRHLSVSTLREISKTLQAAAEETQELGTGPSPRPNAPVPDDPASYTYSENDLVDEDHTAPVFTAVQTPPREDTAQSGPDGSTAPATASLSVWDSYEATSRVEDGEVQYPDSNCDGGLARRIYRTVNGRLDLLLDSTSNCPELVLIPVDPEAEAHAIVSHPDPGNGETPSQLLLYYSPAKGHYKPCDLILKK